MPDDENRQGGKSGDQAAAGQENQQQGENQQQQQGGQGDGSGQSRESLIPRERFDEVNQKAQDLEARNRWLEEQYYSQAGQTGAQAAPQHQADSGDGIPKDYNNWEEWHATDPGAATDWRAKRAYHQERQVIEAQEGRQRFLDTVYNKRPELTDPVKRSTDPTYRRFATLLKDNPASATSERGLNQLWRLAELESGATGTQNQGQGDGRRAGAQEEFHRQAAAGAAYSPTGTGTRQQGGSQQQVQLSAKAERMRARYGLTPEEFLKGMSADHEDSGARIPMKYEKAQRPK